MLDGGTHHQRTVGIDDVGANNVGVTVFGDVVAVVTRLTVGVARGIARRILHRAGEAAQVRRVVANAVAGTRIEAALSLVQVALRPQRGRRQDRGRQRRGVTENRMQIVLRHQESADGRLTPTALQADKRFTATQIASVGVAVN